MGKSRVRTRQMNKTQYMMHLRQKAHKMREHKKNKPPQNSDSVNNLSSEDTSVLSVDKKQPLCTVPVIERTDSAEQNHDSITNKSNDDTKAVESPLPSKRKRKPVFDNFRAGQQCGRIKKEPKNVKKALEPLSCKRKPDTNVDRLDQQHGNTENKLKFAVSVVRNVEQRMCKIKWISYVNNKHQEIEDDTIYYVNAFTRTLNNDESVLSKNINCKGDFYTQHISKDSENSSTNTRSQLLPMVAKVYLYLEKEYEYMKTLNGSNCDLSPLADILKRTAEATGVSEEDVITTLENEDLSDHLPERAKKLRQTIEDLQDGSDDGLISDEEMQEEKHADIEVQKEKIGGGEVQKEKIAEGASEPAPCGSTVIHIPSEEQTKTQSEQVCLKEIRDTSHAEYGDRCVTSDTQVKVEPEEDEVATSVNNLLLQLEPPRTNATVSSDDGNKMEIEQYTFIICNPSEKPTTSNPEDTAVKLEPLDD